MAHIVIVGAGAIGAHVAEHAAWLPNVTRVTVIDRDVYEASNVAAQNIRPADVGKSKAHVQARRLKLSNRALETHAIHSAVEDVPLGWLRADLILACLDSRRARMNVNQAAWRLGVPWIDAGIDASGLLARIQVFIPSNDNPCIECAFDDHDYALVEQVYPCLGAEAVPETGAPSWLGALAASLQAAEAAKVLSSDHSHALVGRDVVLDARHHRQYVTTFQRNAECRMPDHSGWQIRLCNMDPTSTTVAQLAATAATFCGSPGEVRLGVASSPFAVTPACGSCGERLQATYVYRGERRAVTKCPACSGALSVGGFDLQDTVTLEAFSASAPDRSLSELGLLQGDVLTLATSELEMHLELIGELWTEF